MFGMVMDVKLKLDHYLTIREAAKFLGVSPTTLRNWDKSGKLVAFRHPLNKYRLYSKHDLEAILKGVKRET